MAALRVLSFIGEYTLLTVSQGNVCMFGNGEETAFT